MFTRISSNSARAPLSDRDRALMMAVGRRDFAQGKITPEEFADIEERCRVDHLAAVRGLFQRFTRSATTSA
jgi:hypothetical protein